MKYILCCLQEKPYRAGLFETKTLLASLSRTVLKRHGFCKSDLKHKREGVFISSQQKDILLSEEKKYLEQCFFHYLSQAERSPRHVNAWMKRRVIPDRWKEDLILQATSQKYLSRERYVKAFFEKNMQQGKSRWMTQRALRVEGIDLNDEDMKAYPEEQALKKLILNRVKRYQKAISDSQEDSTFERTLMTHLMQKGYRYERVRDEVKEMMKGLSESS